MVFNRKDYDHSGDHRQDNTNLQASLLAMNLGTQWRSASRYPFSFSCHYPAFVRNPPEANGRLTILKLEIHYKPAFVFSKNTPLLSVAIGSDPIAVPIAVWE